MVHILAYIFAIPCIDLGYTRGIGILVDYVARYRRAVLREIMKHSRANGKLRVECKQDHTTLLVLPHFE
jgi:hypothetical protein